MTLPDKSAGMSVSGLNDPREKKDPIVLEVVLITT